MEQSVRLKAKKLERFSGQIIGCNVTIAAPHHHHHQGNLYDVQIKLTVPGATIVAHSGTDETESNQDIHVAIGSAFARLVRQLEDWARVRRGQVKAHGQAEKNS